MNKTLIDLASYLRKTQYFTFHSHFNLNTSQGASSLQYVYVAIFANCSYSLSLSFLDKHSTLIYWLINFHSLWQIDDGSVLGGCLWWSFKKKIWIIVTLLIADCNWSFWKPETKPKSRPLNLGELLTVSFDQSSIQNTIILADPVENYLLSKENLHLLFTPKLFKIMDYKVTWI